MKSIILSVFVLLAVSGCQTAPAFEDGTAPPIRIASIEVLPPSGGKFFWNRRQDELVGAPNCDGPPVATSGRSDIGTGSSSDTTEFSKEECEAENAGLFAKTKELRAEYAEIVKNDLQQKVAPRFTGTRDAKLVATLNEMTTVSAALALVAGGSSRIFGSVQVLDSNTGEVLASVESLGTITGTGGLIGIAIESNSEDAALRLSKGFADETCAWLKGDRAACGLQSF